MTTGPSRNNIVLHRASASKAQNVIQSGRLGRIR
ncbi:hypothetical protein SAMN05421810_102474 [Amycolatopsis arida]|uniref:Uncharacterized protein n=1 Tax=Amycolatopsis arida TaxID=587909 RepID=A0A1I5Q163_9PSEU|nr:hypothetical protein CLV69_101474 [Amycolatopsis arida]SFP39949.1 hypothetical protein SAMN05421810_102474 [Amycolatopsis arida]